MNLPNTLTVLRIVLTPIFLVTLFYTAWYAKAAAFLVFVAASVTDFYDGRLARAGNQVTATGRFLDPLADKILVTSALIALVYDRVVSPWLVVPIVVRDLAIMGMRVYALAHGRQMITSRFAKWKTAVQLFSVVFLLFLLAAQGVMERFVPGAGPLLGGGGLRALGNALLAAALLLTVMSGLQYMVGARFLHKESSV
jgi:CDP-diacylglycerol--glycerol-3-phosphate 3-phosphatidyltransferase